MSKSVLLICPDLETPARLLDARLRAEEAACPDPFVPAQIVVPNASVKSWLQLYLARSQGIVINIQISYLEKVLWNIFQELADALEETSAPLSPPEELTQERYRLLILSILLDENSNTNMGATLKGDELKPLRDYLQKPDLSTRQYCRRVWEVSDRMARLIRDYEYHRQDEHIQLWLKGENYFKPRDAENYALECCERTLFQRIIKPGGLRDILSNAERKTFKTLPQFANEVIEKFSQNHRETALDSENNFSAKRPLHLFGLSQISSYHVRILRWLGQHLELRLYHINPLANAIQQEISRSENRTGGHYSALQRIAQYYKTGAERPADSSLHSTQDSYAPQALLQAWSPAAAATLWGMSHLIEPMSTTSEQPFELEVHIPAATAALATPTVLQRLQAAILKPEIATDIQPIPTLEQDRSLQAVACPGVLREVETIHQSILHNLIKDPTLRPSEIAVLVQDMTTYGPVIQSVFDRRTLNVTTGQTTAPPVPYHLNDSNATESSVFGQALLGLLDMSLHAFTRSSVMAVMLNPCFLEKFKFDREKASTWLDWTEQLCVYQSWDKADKKESGLGDSRFYTWKLALQRLRLGRIMESSGTPDSINTVDSPALNFKDVIPFADSSTSDKESLNIFCNALEQLMPRLLEFQRKAASGKVWASRLRSLVNDFLEVPSDLPDASAAEEAAVRDIFLQSLSQLLTLDAVSKNGKPYELTLPLIREFVQAVLKDLASKTHAQSSGVNVCALQPARPIPYRIVYIPGMGEGKFLASDSPSPFDLRDAFRLPGDIKQSDAQRLQFLEALLATREKLYLLYNDRDLQKDQEFHPASLLQKLLQTVSKHIIGDEFKIIHVPLNPHDPRYLKSQTEEAGAEKSYCDVRVNYSQSDRLLALAENNSAVFVQKIGDELRARLFKHNADSASETPASIRTEQVGLWELRRFLNDPAEAALKRHLRLQDEDEKEPCRDEPFFTDSDQSRQLVQSTLTKVVMQAARSLEQKMPEWREDFERLYHERMLKGEAPDAAFAQADMERFKRLLKSRIEGAEPGSSLQNLLEKFKQAEFCGPVQIGQHYTRCSPKLSFPPARISISDAASKDKNTREVLLNGKSDLVWRSAGSLHITSVLYNSDSKKIPATQLTRDLFDPVLFYLALKAGTEKNADGISSAQWLGARSLQVTLVLEDDFSEYSYTIKPQEALDYLQVLTQEFLNPQHFDTLPFFVISNDKNLRQAYELPDGDETLSELQHSFAQSLEDAVLENEEGSFANSSGNRLRVTDLLETFIPPDAFDKIRRRFQLLDRGPAENRSKKAEAKQEKSEAKASNPSKNKGKG